MAGFPYSQRLAPAILTNKLRLQRYAFMSYITKRNECCSQPLRVSAPVSGVKDERADSEKAQYLGRDKKIIPRYDPSMEWDFLFSISATASSY
jgi:hypothetical protein